MSVATGIVWLTCDLVAGIMTSTGLCIGYGILVAKTLG